MLLFYSSLFHGIPYPFYADNLAQCSESEGNLRLKLMGRFVEASESKRSDDDRREEGWGNYWKSAGIVNNFISFGFKVFRI